jgi:hypothetical protein
MRIASLFTIYIITLFIFLEKVFMGSISNESVELDRYSHYFID